MSLQKCSYCNQRYRFEKLHLRECPKRRKRIRDERLAQSAITEVENVVLPMTPLPIEQKPKRKYTKKEKQ